MKYLDAIVGRLGLVVVVKETWARGMDRRPLDRKRAPLQQRGNRVRGEQANGCRIFRGQPGTYPQVRDGQLRRVPRRTKFLVLFDQVSRQQSVVVVNRRHVEVLLRIQ